MKQPEEIMLTGQEIRARLGRGDTLTARCNITIDEYPGGDNLRVRKGEQFMVSCIGSGRGPDEVIALGGKDLSIPPWYVVHFDVKRMTAESISMRLRMAAKENG